MSRKLLIVFLLPLLLLSCDATTSGGLKKRKKSHDPNQVLDRILETKVLRAATDYGSVSYLIYRGETIGYQYEILKEIASHLQVKLEMVVEKDIETAMEKLNKEEVDIIAMGLTITSARKQLFEFTEPIMTTRQVLVQRKPDQFEKMKTSDEIESHLIRNQIELAGKTIYVQKGTIFKRRLNTLSNEIGDTIHVIEEDRDVEELIEAVANGEIDFTVADHYIALINSRYYQNIDISTPISFPQRIAWIVKKGQTGLADTISSWLIEFNKTLLSRLLYNKYFENLRSSRISRSKYSSFSGGMLSPYDEEIKEASKIVDWDWRLLASMIYQESEFKPNVKSWVGAYGLMQMMPSTFEQYGLDTTASPKEQIDAGAKYLGYLENQLPAEITDKNERIKFTLAAYNCGIGHVLDARRLTEKYKKDPNVWSGQVDEFIYKLSDKTYYHDPVVYYGYIRGEETYRFVNEILQRFEDYKNLIRE